MCPKCSITLLEINQTPQEESETLCATEESSFVADLTEAVLDHEPLKDRWDAIRASKSALLLDQQSWQSKVHLQAYAALRNWTVSANLSFKFQNYLSRNRLFPPRINLKFVL
ncbi:hypothetical protein EJD97_000973 [Solanum chilense]|uniref:Uncharacterized protein n=1 Tax=Solanum chilense TaxID=4083 RepID=A0A6N2C1F4_SOLCI|nr:hypothetical protein EJD97_000973 [Solanum chilense]